MRSHVNDFENMVTVRTKVTCQNEGSWGFEHIRKAFEKDVTPFVKTIKEYFHMFDQGLHKEITDMKEVFTQIETEAAKCSVERKTFEIKEKELLLENDHLLELIISQDLVHTAVNTLAAIADYKHMEKKAKNNSISNLKDHIVTLKRKGVSEGDKSANISKVLALGMYKLNLESLSPMLLRNREADVDYLKYIQEHVDTLREIVEHARALRPLDSDLDSACRAFTINGNTCPLTRFTSTTVVPPKTTNLTTVVKKTPPRSRTSRKLKEITNFGSSSKSKNVVQIVLWYLDSGCSKHMTRQRSQLINFVSKFIGMVKFRNDHVAEIKGYGDYQIGNVTIS
ncbi:hypothetical protein Tco_0562394 [Tanacetum coccineum]